MSLEAYPYGPGQTKGGDTSLNAQADAAANPNNHQMRTDVLDLIEMSNIPLSADCISKDLLFRNRWRARYQNEHHFLQDIRRKCSELRFAKKIADSGTRADGIGGKPVARWTTRGVDFTRKSKPERRAEALRLARAALQHYGCAAAFHTGLTARQALHKIALELDDE